MAFPPAHGMSGTPAEASVTRAGSCDTSTQCGWCGGPMVPEHAHYRCVECGQRDSCCDGPY
jgi:hypothetical protein